MRALVTVYNLEGKADGTTQLPMVFCGGVGLRGDLVRQVATPMCGPRKSFGRQAHSSRPGAGYQVSAESWGTGRAVARVPRVAGSGTHRSGQAAFANMCRSGSTYGSSGRRLRRICRRAPRAQRRLALAAAVAASGVPALVAARGHRVDNVPELPLVVTDEALQLSRTKDARQVLVALGCEADLLRALGARRNKRTCAGPLVIYAARTPPPLVRALRNIPGVDVCHINRLNLRLLAPGGVFGRLCLWTRGAFRGLRRCFALKQRVAPSAKVAAAVVGTTMDTEKNDGEKKIVSRPLCISSCRAPPIGACLTNADISRIINSSEVQVALQPQKLPPPKRPLPHKNPLRNLNALCRLNPAAAHCKKMVRLAQTKGTKRYLSIHRKKDARIAENRKHRKSSKKFMKKVLDSFAHYEVSKPAKS